MLNAFLFSLHLNCILNILNLLNISTLTILNDLYESSSSSYNDLIVFFFKFYLKTNLYTSSSVYHRSLILKHFKLVWVRALCRECSYSEMKWNKQNKVIEIN
jgi:hypothetical protein